MNEDSTHIRLSRRRFLATGGAVVVALPAGLSAQEEKDQESESSGKPNAAAATAQLVSPPEGKRILLAPKLSMIPAKLGDKKLTLADRLTLAKEAGFDGVDFDQAGHHSPAEAREAMLASKMFVHNAINHDHWKKRLTSSKAEERKVSKANIEHCIRVSHAAGGSGVLIVLGHGDDGSPEETVERCQSCIRELLPLAASLGQPILIENVWNKMFYDHDGPPDQGPERFIKFIDSFTSPWVGMYFDIGNHWKYAQPGDWIRQFGHRCVKLDVKGFSRAQNKFTDIGQGDLPWDDVRKALGEIGYTGWATAEVGGGDLERLMQVRKQMQEALGA